MFINITTDEDQTVILKSLVKFSNVYYIFHKNTAYSDRTVHASFKADICRL